MGGTIMNLHAALVAAGNGCFVTNQYFDNTQSLHYYKGNFYYEDGAVVSVEFLKSQDFAINGNWSIVATKDEIDYHKLSQMHTDSNGYMLIDHSYMECINKH